MDCVYDLAASMSDKDTAKSTRHTFFHALTCSSFQILNASGLEEDTWDPLEMSCVLV